MKYYLSLIAIFKNETAILEEWLEHYLMEGVNHFYLINNGSTDAYLNILNPYLQDGSVECVTDERKHMQTEYYNLYFLKKAKEETEWVMIVDLDEFIYSRKGFKKISDYLVSLEKNIGQVYVPWKLFGSSGLIDQPRSCINSMTGRTEYKGDKTNGMNSNNQILTKTIVRTTYLQSIWIHKSVTVQDARQITSDGRNAGSDNYQLITEPILKQSVLHCNHYPLQSYEWFRRIKMTRGSASTSVNDTVRTIDYYNSFESHSNQINDRELADKWGKIRFYYGLGTYRDVTRKVYMQFFDPVQNHIMINKSANFNQCFGDPCRGSSKCLIIQYQYQHRLSIYPEAGHDQIIIKLDT